MSDISQQKIQQDIIEEINIFENRVDKYEYIIELGKTLEPLSNEMKNDNARVKGCQSNVWLHAREKEGLLFFQADSDAFIVKGLIVLLLKLFSGQRPHTIMATEMTPFIQKAGLDELLSPNRANGLQAMIKQIKYFALAATATKQINESH